MGGGGRMDGEALGVADVGQMFEDPEFLDEPLAGGRATLDAEDDHPAAMAAEIFLRRRVLRIVS